MISSARIGISREDSKRRQIGEVSSPAVDFINGVETTEAFSLNSTEPASAISSKRFSEAVAAARPSADLADAKPRLSAERTSKRTSWSRSRKRCMDRPERFRYGEVVQTKLKRTRSKSRAASMKGSG